MASFWIGEDQIMATRKKGHAASPSATARRKTTPAGRKKADDGTTPSGPKRYDRSANAAPKVKAKTKPALPKTGTDKGTRKLSASQRDTLARISQSGPNGFVLEEKRLNRTITSLLARDLIRRSGSGSAQNPYRYHLTKAGDQSLALTPAVGPSRAKGAPKKRMARAFRPPTATLRRGDLVRIIDDQVFEGREGRVTDVLQNGKARVHITEPNGVFFDKSFDIDQLEKL